MLNKVKMLSKKEVINKKVVSLLYDNEIIKNFNYFIKMKKDINKTNKLFEKGKISEYNYKNYLKKIKRENELLKNKVEFLDEVLFETEDCVLSAIFENGKIKYCLNQYGMKNYYNNLENAVENLVRISL